MTFGLGLDTGGTYTDAVVMSLSNGALICKAKALTTREDLTIGIREAISAMDRDFLQKVDVVSLSSTLATNTVVEGKGCRVALVCIGSEYDGKMNPDYSVNLAGGHNLKGEETSPLDESALRRFLESVRGRVDGVAITGYMSVRNPDHENRAKEITREILNVPVVCGHDLSSSLGFNERTSTCVMNSRLIPVIDDLIRSVKKVLAEFGIRAPLMIVKGDGTMMGEEVARERPVETILSGPAASIMGALHLVGVNDAIVMDMGGTTTDIGILRDGKPRLDPEGAIIGGHRTRVIAAEIATSGIGGDSRILVNGRRLVQSPVRVMPICIAAHKWKEVREYYHGLDHTEARFVPESMTDEKLVLETEMVRTLRIPEDRSDISESDYRLLEFAVDRPHSLQEVSSVLGVHSFMFNVSKLESRGYLQRVGLTPTDLLHADGTYRQYDHLSSLSAIRFLARKLNCTCDAFLIKAKRLVRDKVCLELMRELIREETGSDRIEGSAMMLLKRAMSPLGRGEFDCRIRVRKPIIGIGAPAGVYMRWVGEVFDTQVLIDENSDVGNAIGAVTSSVSESLDVLIKPLSMGDTDSRFEAFSKLGHFVYDTREEAMTDSLLRGGTHLMNLVKRSGVADATLVHELDEKKFQYGDSTGEVLMELRLKITAIGKPKVF